MISARTQSLLDRVPDHALAPAIRNSVIDAMSAADRFAARKAELAKSGTLTEMGKRQALRDALTNEFGRQVARARDPIVKARKEIAARRGALVVKAVDPTNVAAALERQEVRAWLRGLDLNTRQSVALTTKDRRVLEAMVTAPPELSGFDGNLAALAEQVEERYLELTYGDEIKSLKAMEAVVAEGDAAVQVARVLIQGAADMDTRVFEQIMQPIESRVGAPWLFTNSKNADGSDYVQVITRNEKDGLWDYRPATDAEKANGVFYKDAAEYQAARAA